MGGDTRKYHFYLIFGNTKKNEEPWNREEWTNKIEPVLDCILKQSPYYEKTGLCSLQYNPRPNSVYFDELKFGKLRWDKKSHEKWTLTKQDVDRKFIRIDCWTPLKTVCDKNNSSPDVYFSIGSEKNSNDKEKLEFDLFIVIAVAEDLNYNPGEKILELSKILSAKKTVYKSRLWEGTKGRDKSSNWVFINSVSDTKTFGIYKGETLDIHDTKFEELKFEPFWEILYSS